MVVECPIVEDGDKGVSEHLSNEELYFKCVEELKETECNYLSSLNYLVEHYYEPLKVLQFVSDVELQSVFSSVVVLRNFSKQFYADLQNPFESVPDVFLGISSFLKLYSAYCAHYQAAVDEVIQLKEKNTRFCSFCKEQEAAEDAHGLSLSDLLIKPVQRVLKYPLFIRSMLKYTSPTDPDRSKLEQVIILLEEVSRYINKSTEKEDMMHKVIEVDKKLVFPTKDFTLVQPSRYYVHEGQVTVVHNKRKAKEQVFLFSDCVVFASKHSFNCRKIVYFSNVDSIFRLSEVKKTEDTFGHTVRFWFELAEVTHKGEDITRFVSQKEERVQEWIKKIAHTLQDLHQRVQSRHITKVRRATSLLTPLHHNDTFMDSTPALEPSRIISDANPQAHPQLVSLTRHPNSIHSADFPSQTPQTTQHAASDHIVDFRKSLRPQVGYLRELNDRLSARKGLSISLDH